MIDFTIEWDFRRRFDPATLDKYEEYDRNWHYSHTEFYEIEETDEDYVIVHFFKGNDEVGSRVTARSELTYCEKFWSSQMYFRTPDERIKG